MRARTIVIFKEKNISCCKNIETIKAGIRLA